MNPAGDSGAGAFQPRFENAPCPGCGETASKPVWRARDRLCGVPGAFTVARCAQCGLYRQEPRVVPSDIGAYYPEDYVVYADAAPAATAQGRLDGWRRDLIDLKTGARRFGFARRVALTALSALRRFRYHPFAHAGGGRRLLDVGCGLGHDMAAMAARGWRVSGIEANEKAAEKARGRGFDVTTGLFPDAVSWIGNFDAIVMSQVLEHFPDPGAALDAAHRLLTPGGLLWIATPWRDGLCARIFGADWYALEQPRHYVLFSPGDLSRMLRSRGFRVAWTWSHSSTASWTRSLVYRREGGPREGAARRWDASRLVHRMLGPAIRTLDALGLGDGGMLLAVKPETGEPPAQRG